MRRKRRSPKELLMIGGLSVLLIALVLMVWNIFKKEEIARVAAMESRKELELLSERETSLTASIAELNTERGREASLRETYGVAKPGEEVIIVVSSPEEKALEALPWWRSFLGWFGF